LKYGRAHPNSGFDSFAEHFIVSKEVSVDCESASFPLGQVS
jgi:hypothetical protein